MPRRNRRISDTDANYGYTHGDQVLAYAHCPRCPAPFAADDQDQADQALADHLANAHDRETE